MRRLLASRLLICGKQQASDWANHGIFFWKKASFEFDELILCLQKKSRPFLYAGTCRRTFFRREKVAFRLLSCTVKPIASPSLPAHKLLK